VWSNKAADIATAHVLLGVLSSLTGSIVSVVIIGRSNVSNTDLKDGLNLGGVDKLADLARSEPIS
jgi:hypothetical protein